MRRLAAIMLGLGAVLATAPQPADAIPLAATRLGNPIQKSTPMQLGKTVLAPIAAIRFCMDNADECPSGGEPQTVALTEARWAELETINRTVNAAIAPKPDRGIDTWTLGATAGDCDDYAVQKRHELIARGWPSGAVTLAVARIAGGEFHLVVVVATDRGDYVLDNLHAAVMPWRRTGYGWMMRSEARDPRLWQAIDREAPVQVAHTTIKSPHRNGTAATTAADRVAEAKAAINQPAIIKTSLTAVAADAVAEQLTP
jgi:predicted transglutaminase-like cysteine proteinase